jgi:hypothetical protein
MSEDLFLARLFLIGGAALALVGLVLWFALPIPSQLPPFVLTPLLALAYGAFCWQLHRRHSARTP